MLKTTRILMQIKRNVKKCISDTKDKERREHLKLRQKLLTQHIMEDLHKANKKKIIQTVNNMKAKDGTLNRNTFWDFKRKIEPKKKIEQGGTINNKDGEKEEDITKIKEVYRAWYSELFETRESLSVAEKENEKR